MFKQPKWDSCNVGHKKVCISFEYGAMDVKNHLVVQKKKNWKMNERKPFKENDCTNIQKPTLLLSEAPEYQCDEGERISSENITTYSVPSLGKPKTTVFFVCFFFLFFCRRKDDKSFSR